MLSSRMVYNGPRVWVKGVRKIISDRINESGEEQYLIVWKPTDGPVDKKYPPMSWQNVNELDVVLSKLQEYLDSLPPGHRATRSGASKKRPSPANHEARASPVDRLRLGSESRSPSFDGKIAASTTGPEVFNGKRIIDSFIKVTSASGPDIPRLRLSEVPKPQISSTEARQAELKVRETFLQRLKDLPAPPVELVNRYDYSTPSVSFQFIDQSILRDGVFALPKETIEGCKQCKPHMGRHIGCEYSKKCDCLEYAEVIETNLTDEERAQWQRALAGQDTFMGLPKRFPYLSTDSERNGCLQSSYLNSRNTIYECNENCGCGPNCKNRNVQHGRRVPLEIFKTESRGWGLRCKKPLLKGQFIDTYRGEIITSAEADRREEKSGRTAKASYLYSLDKFKEQIDADFHVIDGQHFGGPTRFMNHSCDPNCRQYAVSYNKNDYMVYEIAFFAIEDIPANTELTFDYMDQDEIEEPKESEVLDGEDEEDGQHRTKCLCGASNCRGWLWI